MNLLRKSRKKPDGIYGGNPGGITEALPSDILGGFPIWNAWAFLDEYLQKLVELS